MAEATNEKALATEISELAEDIQSRASEVQCLLSAIDDASDDISSSSEGDAEAIGKLIVFARLAKNATQQAMELGEQIELLARKVGR